MSRINAAREVVDAWIALTPAPAGETVTYIGPVRGVHFDRPRGWVSDVFRAVEAEPKEVIRVIQSCRPGPHVIRVWTSDPDGSTDRYAELGYEPLSSDVDETVMARSLVGLKTGEERYPVQCVRTDEQRRFYNSAFDPDLDPDDPHGAMKEEELGHPRLRHYFVEMDGECVGQAKAILPPVAAVVVEPLGVKEEYRRRGIATALMNRLHADAVRDGAERSVIIASPMGVPLYMRLGYEVVACIRKFVPCSKPRGG
jgi:GNAT superfamily N-acetyltransferase